MMKVLVLGGNGMLGHKLLQIWRRRFDVYTTIRKRKCFFSKYQLIDPEKVIDNIDVENFIGVENIIARVNPDAIVNAVGIIKQKESLFNREMFFKVNGEFPNRLAKLSTKIGARLINISTDCVYDGQKGNCRESDLPNATDIYGLSKIKGEINEKHCLTIRTSLIGRELNGKAGLLEWFLNQSGETVEGYKNAIFSGFPTLILADILSDILINQTALEGIYHVSSNPISKFELLKLIRKKFSVSVVIKPFENFNIDRSLNGEKFNKDASFKPPDWVTMIEKMSKDPFPYHKFNR